MNVLTNVKIMPHFKNLVFYACQTLDWIKKQLLQIQNENTNHNVIILDLNKIHLKDFLNTFSSGAHEHFEFSWARKVKAIAHRLKG